MEPIKIKENMYVNLLEYNGKYRIEQGNPGQDGKWWAKRVIPMEWNKEQRKRMPGEKEENVKVQLGDRATARVALTVMLSVLNAPDDLPKPIDEESEAPF